MAFPILSPVSPFNRAAPPVSAIKWIEVGNAVSPFNRPLFPNVINRVGNKWLNGRSGENYSVLVSKAEGDHYAREFPHLSATTLTEPNAQMASGRQPGDCPMGGHHTTRLWIDRKGLACRRCHKTWKFTPRGAVPTWPEATP